jgi:hypothetical protein
VNHRELRPKSYPVKFGVRSGNASKKKAEYQTIRDGPETLSLCPRYATRVLRTGSGDVDHFRVVSLVSFSKAIRAGLKPDGRYENEYGQVFYFYDYRTLADVGCMVHDSTGEHA